MKDYTPNAALDISEDSYITTVTPNLFDKTRYFYAQELGELKAGRRYYTERDSLPSYLLLYTLGGSGKLLYGDREYALLPGDVAFLDCMPFQRYETGAEGTWHLKFAHVYGLSVAHYYELFVKEGTNVIHIPASSHVPYYLDRLLQLYRPRSINSDLIASMRIVELLTELILNAKDVTSYDAEDYLFRAAEYMEAHYGEKLTLDMLSAHLSVSKYHLQRKFKAHFGISPAQYLNNLRINRAKELLRTTNMPVYEICECVGVENPSYLIKLFRDHEGMTPYGYRKMWR